MKINDINSNLGYILVGIYVMLSHDFLTGFSILLMGLGSAWSHQFGDYERDWEGMWICFTMLFAYWTGFLVESLVVLFLIITFIEDWLRKMPGIFGFGLHWILLGVIYLSQAIASYWVVCPIYASLSVILFVTALYIRQKSHPWWHILTAIGILVLFINF